MLIVINLLLLFAVTKINSISTQKNSIIAIGQTKTYGDVSITATNVKTETGYVMGIKPDVDQKIISTTLTITNNSAQDFEFYPSVQTFVRDNQGSTFIMVPVELETPFASATILPGQTKSGQVSYVVPSRVIPLFLYIESRQANAGPFVIKLQ